MIFVLQIHKHSVVTKQTLSVGTLAKRRGNIFNYIYYLPMLFCLLNLQVVQYATLFVVLRSPNVESTMSK